MKKLTTLVTVVFLLLFMLTNTIEANDQSEGLKNSRKTFIDYFDTTLVFDIYAENEVPDEHWNEIEAILKRVQNTFDRMEKDSELYRLNASAGGDAPFPVSKDLYVVIHRAFEFADLTGGKYNPAIGPLLDLWGTPGAVTKIPTEQEIESIKKLYAYDKVKDKITCHEDDEGNYSIHLLEKGMALDLGSIAKGYAADLLRDKINALGYEHAVIDLGMSSISLIGNRPEPLEKGNDNWRIGLKNPNPLFCNKKGECQDRIFGAIEVSDVTITTTGTDQRFWFIPNDPEGKKYHHILDPDTGFPVHNIIEQVTVISEDATLGDALSTSLKAVGIKKGLEIVETLKQKENIEIEAIFLTYNREIYVTSGIGTTIPFTILHDSFKIKNISELKNEDKIIHYERPNNVTKPLLMALGIMAGTSLVIGGAALIVKKVREP